MRLTNDIIKDSAAFVKRREQFLSAVFPKCAFAGRMGRPAPAYRGGHTGRTPWLGLLFRAHFLTLCCYPRHNSAAAPPSMLLSGTQFSPSRIGAARTVCRPAVVIQRIISLGRSRRDCHGRVVIPHTFCSFDPPCPVLLFSTHFIPENNAVVIGSTIRPCGISVFCDFLYCYSAHILQFVEFRQGCYPQHNS